MLPFKVLHLVVSYATDYLFTSKTLELKFDFFGCFKYNNQGDVVAARSRLMKHQQEQYEMDNLKNGGDMVIPRPSVGAYKNDGYN